MAETEGRHAAEFLMLEEGMSYSRDVVTIVQSAALVPGSVLGKITATGKYILSPITTVTATTGADTAVAVLLYGVDATSADVTNAVVVSRHAVVNKNLLTYHADVDDDAKKATKIGHLKTVGIIAR